jgi:glycosyltransferase involved in cell wall biosynthesis
MNLIIQIPCSSEGDLLPATLRDLPRTVRGVSDVRWLVVDDGSADRTIDRAWQHGADHVVKLTNTQGHDAAFRAGLDASLKLGADIIVNTDIGDPHEGEDIPTLLGPILVGDADIVVGTHESFRAYSRDAALEMVSKYSS